MKMLQLKEIHTTDVEQYNYIEQLMVGTFPPNEYRPLTELREYTDCRENFHMNVVLDGCNPIGLIAYWDFEKFYYIEYLAMDSSLRNKGYGTKTLQAFCSELDKPVVLEIELPDTEEAIRRKQFYERNHFVAWPNEYFQPPFREGDGLLPVMICCYGNLIPETHFELVKRQIHTEVYNYYGE